MTRMRTMLWFVVAGVMWCAPGVWAVTPAELVGPDLQPVAVSLQSLRDGTLTYFDAERNLQTSRAEAYVQVRFDHSTLPAAQAKAPSVIVLTDGQRLPGKLVDADADGQTVVWQHALLGKATISIDRIAQLRFGDAVTAVSEAAAGGDGDRVVLENGDVMTGFVTAVHARGVELQPANARDAIIVPIDRLRSVTLTGNPPPTTGPPDMVHLTDGTRVAAAQLTLAGDAAQVQGALFTIDAAPRAVPVWQIMRIDLANTKYRLVPLTSFSFDHMSQPVFGIDMPPRVEAGVLHMHAPLKLAFNLPAKAVRIAAVAELDVDADLPDDAVRWTDFELTIERDGKAIEQHRITAARRRAVLNIAVAQGVISLYLDPATNGPVMDRLRLVDAVVLLQIEKK